MQAIFPFPKIARRIIFLLPFLMLGLLLLLSFFCYPAAEDLSIHYYNNSKGLVGNIRDFYRDDSSRFFSFPLLFLLLDGDFIITHYYIVPVLLLLSLWMAFYRLVSVINKDVVQGDGNKRILLWLSALLLFSFAAIAFDPATIFYWISGSITYLPSFIFFLLLAAQLARVYYKGEATAVDAIVCVVLTIGISGSNEISLCFLFAFLVINSWLFYRVNKRHSYLLLTLIAVIIVCILLLIIPGGSGKRAQPPGSSHSLPGGLAAAFLYTARTLYHIVAEPLSWILVLLCWVNGNRLPAGKKAIFKKAGLRGVYILLGCLAVSFGFYFMIYFLSGELLPPRANSLVGFYVLFFLLAAAFFSGSNTAQFSWKGWQEIGTLAGLAVIVLIVTSDLFLTASKDIFRGYAYHKIMKGREASIEDAKRKGENVSRVNDYDTDFDSLARQHPMRKFMGSLLDKLNGYPALIHYADPVQDTSLYIHYYAEYRQIDSIRYHGKSFKRIGLFPGE